MKTKTKEKQSAQRPTPVQEEEDTDKLTWCLDPQDVSWPTCQVKVWITSCRRYRVTRVESPTRDSIGFAAEFREKSSWFTFEHDSKMGSGYPRYYKHLEDALLSVEQYHARKHATFTSNRDEVLGHAHSLGIDGGRRKAIREDVPGTSGTEVAREAPRVKRSRGNNKMSCLDAAAQVLRDEGRPLHLKEMIKLMEERDYWSSPGGATPDRTLGAAISVATRKGDKRFQAEGKSIFSLNQ